MDEDRPGIRALVAYDALPYALIVREEVVTLEEAAEYALVGFNVLVDPQDEEDLVRWEQIQRAMRPKRKWFESD